MEQELSAEEVRVIGCLLEKAVTTPDQYPLSLNALTNACNQKSSREPVMNLSQGTVEHVTRELEERRLISRSEGKSSVSKFSQRFCNTLLGSYKFEPPEYAIITVLMLRGPQTPGELRTRTARLHTFEDNDAVRASLVHLMEREGGPLVARLPRLAGRQDHQYMHLFAGAVESVAEDEAVVDKPAGHRSDRVAELEQRVEVLERALQALAAKLGEEVDLTPVTSEPTGTASEE